MKVGFIGLGSIGAPMAGRILEAGMELVAWNRSPDKAQELKHKGALVAYTPAELASLCDTVCTCVSDAHALEIVVFGKRGLATAATPPRYLVDHSTISPAKTRHLSAKLLEATGTVWVDAPISGGRSGAIAGTLATFVGGPEDAVRAVTPVLRAFCGNVTHMGPSGCGQATKACNQVIGFLSFLAAAEGLHLAEKLGIDPAMLPVAMRGGFADIPALQEWRRASCSGEGLIGPALHIEAMRAFLRGSAQEPLYVGASPENFAKDIGIIRDVAREMGITLPMTEQMAVLVGLLRSNRQSP